MTRFLLIDIISWILPRKSLHLAVTLLMLSLAVMSAVSASAQSVPDVSPVDCGCLPTKEEFIKIDYGKETIKKIQRCLKEKGLFNAPAHGVKGPITIAALEKYHAQKTAVGVGASGAKPAKVDCNALPSKEQFVKQSYDADKIKIIQGCLAAKGYYKGAINGQKGQALIDALGKSQAERIVLKRATGKVSCANLPSQKTFIKGRYDKKSIEIIQGCLWEKGYYTGPIDGLKGPLTIAALGRFSGGESVLPSSIKPGGPFVVFSLTNNDFEEMKAANGILDTLQELKGEEYASNDELKEKVRQALKEVTDLYDKSLSMALNHVEQLKSPILTEQDIKDIKEADPDVSDTVIGSLRELQDEKFSEKSLLVRAVNTKLNEISDPYRFLLTPILKDVNGLATNTLPDRFFADLEARRIPAAVLKKLKRIQNVEYTNSRLFVNALETNILNPMKNNKEIDQAAFDMYESLLLAKAAKEHLFDKSKQVQWSGGSSGCYLDDFSGVVYGFYPFWLSGGKQKLDFSALTRVGYFAVTFDEKGEIERHDWQPERATSFINKARQYRTKIDLVIYRNDWQNWSKFVAARKTSFSEKLTNSIVDAVTEKVTDSAMERVKTILSLGSSRLPAMGDGVTLFFDGYPEDTTSAEFFRMFVKNLHTRLRAANKLLSVVLPMQALGKIAELKGDADFFLILMEEPTTDTKKRLRQEVENLFKGAERRSVLRKIVPVITPAGHDFDNSTEQQLKDDLIYYQDNFGGVGFWPLPTSRDNGATELNNLVRATFALNGSQDFFQSRLHRGAPWFGRIVGPHRWAFRITFDILLIVLLTYAVLAFWIFELREIFRKYFWWFVAMGALALLTQTCLFLWDPYWRGKTTGILALLLIAGVLVTVWGYVRKMKQVNLP
jgi:hypothetical protein